MSIRGFLVIAAALFALALVAGCGGSDDSATGSSSGSSEVTVKTGSLSKAAYIKRASSTCTKTRGEFEKKMIAVFEDAQKNPPKPTEPSYEAGFFETGFPRIYEKQIAEVSAIGVPRGDEEEITAFLEALQDGLDQARKEPEAFGEDFLESGRTIGSATKLAKAYGLIGCAE